MQRKTLYLEATFKGSLVLRW